MKSSNSTAQTAATRQLNLGGDPLSARLAVKATSQDTDAPLCSVLVSNYKPYNLNLDIVIIITKHIQR